MFDPASGRNYVVPSRRAELTPLRFNGLRVAASACGDLGQFGARRRTSEAAPGGFFMRSRIIRPGFFSNEALVALPPLTRIFFVGLWCHADRQGRLLDRPGKLKFMILPGDACSGEEMLAQLTTAGFLVRYEVAGTHYLWIRNFRKQQGRNIHPHEQNSVLPPCEFDGSSVQEEHLGAPIGSPLQPARGAPCRALTSFPSCTSSPSEEEQDKEHPKKDACSEPAKKPDSEPPPVLVFPTKGTGAREWKLSEKKLAEYVESFPGADVLAECRKARQWCIDNPARRNTARGMPAFLARWLGKVQDQGRGPARPKSRGQARQEVLEQWLRERETTSPGASTTRSDSDSATATPNS